ncbi:MAG: DUF4294 domain-containing protein [Bacteroidetes bacterium]|nr:DUF4294 domain-containing protein [Bacteroidota bacterium]
MPVDRLYRSIAFTAAILGATAGSAQWTPGKNDTLFVPVIVVAGDTMTFRELEMVLVYGPMTEAQREAYRRWTRLRNAVYVTYPYARKAGAVFNEINRHLTHIPERRKREVYIKSKESALRKEFTTPLTNLSVYQGKVLMKIINRETSNTCYDIIREYKGSFSARFWQTVAWIFGSSLKQDYNPLGEDAELENIVLEVARMYGDI